MDGIELKIDGRKALINKMVSAINANKDMGSIQQEWLLKVILAFFKEKEDPDRWWNYTQKELIARLKEQGVQPSSITKNTSDSWGYSYRGRQDDLMAVHHKVKFSNYEVSMSHYRGSRSGEGETFGIHVSFFNYYYSVDLRYMPPERAAAALIELDTLIPRWKETLWPPLLLEAQKAAKKKSISENTVETLVKMKLADMDIKYYIVKQQTRMKVLFNINGKMQLGWFISHKSFMEQIDSVIDAVKMIKNTVDKTGSTFTAKKLDNDINWK